MREQRTRVRWGMEQRPAALIVALLIALAVVAPASATMSPPDASSDELWVDLAEEPPASKNGAAAQVRPVEFRAVAINSDGLAAALADAPEEGSDDGVVVELPAPDGSTQRFALEELSIVEDELAAAHPDIATYTGVGIDDPAATIRADLGPLGFHASVRAPSGSWYIDPYYRGSDEVYASYFVADARNTHGIFVEREGPSDEAVEDLLDTFSTLDMTAEDEVPQGPEVQLRQYRLALLSNPGYATYFGADNVTAAKVTLMNRVNQIYEAETGIRMLLIGNNDLLNLNTVEQMSGANGPCGTVPCFTAAQSNSCGSATLGRNRLTIGQIVGASAYDVGHIILGNPGGGVASLASVGGNNKAQGCTGLAAPVGDFFAVDYVAHEIGHQFAGNHTFNGTTSNCSGSNRSAANSVEPGSGSSIMAYAGICGNDNLQPNSDPYWSQRSYQEITTFVNSDRAAINEVQNVSLVGFDTDGDSFRLRFNGEVSAPIVRGTNYSTAGIQEAIAGIPGWPGGTVAIANFAGGGSPSDGGFQFTFNTAPLAGTNVAEFEVVDFEGASGFVGETAKGGPVDNKGHIVTPTGNHAPVAEAAESFTIPLRTPFALTGSATDYDDDELTYLWEQNDRGAAAGTALRNNTKLNGPLFRVFGTPLQRPPYVPTQYRPEGQNHPTTNPSRTFPDLQQILDGRTNAATGACGSTDVECFSEFLPTSDYVGFAGVNASPARLNFRFTARDNRGGVGTANTVLYLASGTGPFLVTGPGSDTVASRSSDVTVTWDVAGTNADPINVTDVKISLSIDGGQTFPYVLTESTTNDGSQQVTLPNVTSTMAKVKVEAVGNVFFDISDDNFTIEGRTATASGHIPANQPGGSHAPDAGTNLDIGLQIPAGLGSGYGDFSVRYRSAGQRLLLDAEALDSVWLGQFNDDGGCIAAPSAACPAHGAITGTASLYDVASSRTPVLVAEDLTFEAWFADLGEPSRLDAMRINVWDSEGALVFSNTWIPTTSSEGRRATWTLTVN